MGHDLGERRKRPYLEPAPGLTHATKLLDLFQRHDRFGTLDPVLEPVHAVQPTGQHPRLLPVSTEESDGIFDGRRLEEHLLQR